MSAGCCDVKLSVEPFMKAGEMAVRFCWEVVISNDSDSELSVTSLHVTGQFRGNGLVEGVDSGIY